MNDRVRTMAIAPAPRRSALPHLPPEIEDELRALLEMLVCSGAEPEEARRARAEASLLGLLRRWTARIRLAKEHHESAEIKIAHRWNRGEHVEFRWRGDDRC